MSKLGLIPLRSRVQEATARYARAGAEIRDVLKGLTVETYTPARAGSTLSKVESVVRELDAFGRRWAKKSLPAAYKEGRRVAEATLQMIGARRNPRFKQSRHDRAARRYAEATFKDLTHANRTIRGEAGKYIAAVALGRQAADRAREREISEAQAFDMGVINKIIKKARTLDPKYGKHRAEGWVVRAIDGYLQKFAEAGKFIKIIGRDGKARLYNLRDYAETVARTKMREAQTRALEESCKEWENDLVQFSKHADPCPICSPLEGKIFSISGKHPTYPKLTDAERPPIHCRCEHSLNATSEIALRAREKYAG